MKIGKIIKNYRENTKISLRDFAERCGASHSYISMLENGKNSTTGEPIIPSITMLKKISDGMGMSVNDLISICDDMPIKLSDIEPRLNLQLFAEPFPKDARPIKTKRLPMLGNVACGEPIFADESHESYVDANSDTDADFCLTAKGDSMINARIFNGDILFVKSQPTVENGEIAVVLIEDEATVKRVYYDKENNVITLAPENPLYKPMRYEGAKLDQIRILGKVVSGQYKI